MQLYHERTKELFDSLERGRTHEERERNRARVLEARQGDYLIKSTCKYLCQTGNGYISASFRAFGWLPLDCRAQAQWFTKQEAQEILAHWNHPTQWKMVKR